MIVSKNFTLLKSNVSRETFDFKIIQYNYIKLFGNISNREFTLQ